MKKASDAYKRIVLDFSFQGGIGTVSGKDARILWQDEELFADAFNKRFAVPFMEIGAADSLEKQGVAGKQHTQIVRIQANAPLSMTRCMNNLKARFKHGIAFFENYIRIREVFAELGEYFIWSLFHVQESRAKWISWTL